MGSYAETEAKRRYSAGTKVYAAGQAARKAKSKGSIWQRVKRKLGLM